jgi:hypothetical protein
LSTKWATMKLPKARRPCRLTSRYNNTEKSNFRSDPSDLLVGLLGWEGLQRGWSAQWRRSWASWTRFLRISRDSASCAHLPPSRLNPQSTCRRTLDSRYGSVNSAGPWNDKLYKLFLCFNKIPVCRKSRLTKVEKGLPGFLVSKKNGHRPELELKKRSHWLKV